VALKFCAKRDKKKWEIFDYFLQVTTCAASAVQSVGKKLSSTKNDYIVPDIK